MAAPQGSKPTCPPGNDGGAAGDPSLYCIDLVPVPDASGLPDAATLGPYSSYVAWATTPLLDPVVRLGGVSNGRNSLGRVRFNKFLLLLTAEASPPAERWKGRIERVVMYGYNKQYPGPLIRVTEGATIVVEFTNRIDWPTLERIAFVRQPCDSLNCRGVR